MPDDDSMTLPQYRTWHSVMRGFNPTIKFMWDLNEEPPNSQYETHGHPDGHGFRYFVVADQDDDNLYYYLPETEQVREKVEQIPNQQWVKLNATGGKDEPADIDPVAVEVNESQTSQNGAQGGSSRNEDRLGPDNVIESYLLTIKAMKEMAGGLVMDDNGELTEEGFKHIKTVFIQWYNTGRFMPLYPGQGEEDKPEEEPEPQEETAPPLGDGDLPF